MRSGGVQTSQIDSRSYLFGLDPCQDRGAGNGVLGFFDRRIGELDC